MAARLCGRKIRRRIDKRQQRDPKLRGKGGTKKDDRNAPED